MLKFDYEGRKVEVLFEHRDYIKNRHLTKLTICAIMFDGATFGLGCAKTSPEDNFNRNTGRKIALARALKDGFDGDEHKAFRTLVWQKYFEARNGRKE